MKKTFLIGMVCFLAYFPCAKAQNGFQKTYYANTKHDETALCVTPTLKRGEYAFCGANSGLMYLFKLDANGDFIYETFVDSGSSASVIRQYADSSYICLAHRINYTSMLVRLNANMDTIATKSIGVDGYFNSMFMEADGNFLLYGKAFYKYDKAANKLYGAALVKVDTNGKMLWKKVMPMERGWNISKCIKAKTGYYFLTSTWVNATNGSGAYEVRYLIKTNLIGDTTMRMTSNATTLLVVNDSQILTGNDDGYSLMDSTGKRIWGMKTPAYGGHIITKLLDGNYVMTAQVNNGFDTGTFKLLRRIKVIKFNSSGVMLDSTSYSVRSSGTANWVEATADSGFIIAGSVGSKLQKVVGSHLVNIDEFDVYVIKADKNLKAVYTNIYTPKGSQMGSIYPNPTQGVFRIGGLQNSAGASIKVFNLLGGCVYQSSITTPEKEIDLSTQPKGIYIYQIQTEKGLAGAGKIVKE
ncbi:MAG: T9SS type A sorting domain-containing protein [Bacteroidetes bacterium]|nr:T9SS type A sorting domain-containing protein [Bacteroidota bacterium]